MAHSLGLKSIAIYRDGSKLSQPLSSAAPSLSIAEIEQKAQLTNRAIANSPPPCPDVSGDPPDIDDGIWDPQPDGTYKPRHGGQHYGVLENKPLKRGQRERLPWVRKGITQKVRIGGQTLYLRTGEYDDGRLGEFFLNMSKEGSTARALIEGFAKACSIAIQYGTPLDVLSDAFTGVRFEPSGIVEGHDAIHMCSSILDLVFRDLAQRYLYTKTEAGLESFAKDLANKQQPLGEEFEKVLYDNRYELYVASTAGAAQVRPTGELCPECGNELRHAGSCWQCHNCSYNTGCG
jgi:ribonucleoside-diphosphate reductase alpha chain